MQNLPFGIFSTQKLRDRRAGVAISDKVLDLKAVSKAGLFTGPILSKSAGPGGCFDQGTLNSFASLGQPAWKEARYTVQHLLSATESILRDDHQLQADCLVPQEEAIMHMPVSIGDYTDFYAAKEHASNMGALFRGKENPLCPNWVHLPVAYHGRSSSIIISGTDVRRPRGQVHGGGEGPPTFQPCNVMDFELEMAVIVGPGNADGTPIPVDQAEEHIFGLVLMNDWSARDIQRWEMLPLGPFNSKNFATSISPWIVTLDALEPFRCSAPQQEPEVLPYLRETNRGNYDIPLQVAIQPEGTQQPHTVTRSNLRHLYWTLPQMLAHHTAGGCNLRPGDLIGSGTISCPAEDGKGCLAELTAGGKVPTSIGGKPYRFLQDGDAVTISGLCEKDGLKIGFGNCIGKILPARPGPV
ncbi:hypothetical protein WJX74_005658 [Apatococcus lobatus]|uniref:Fumarylacetoacetase n=2 Tax=Apatococcus TaxID=904362 RepID=A0AAW1S131_9CHLO